MQIPLTPPGQMAGDRAAVMRPERLSPAQLQSEPANIPADLLYRQMQTLCRFVVQHLKGRQPELPSSPMRLRRIWQCVLVVPYPIEEENRPEEVNWQRSTLKPVGPSPLDLETYLVSPHLPTGPEIAIHGKGPQGEILAIPMISEIKHARKSCPRMTNLLP